MSEGELRSSAIKAAVAGGIASAALMIHAGRNSQQGVIIGLFVIWVTFPFLAMLAATIAAAHWAARTQAALYRLMLFISATSVFAYLYGAFLMKVRNTPVFVMVAPLSVILGIIWLGVAAIAKRRKA